MPAVGHRLHCQNSWLVVVGNHVAIFSTTIVFVAIDECALLLSGGVDAALGLSADSTAELLNVCKLALHCVQAVGLALHGFLHGGICGTEVCK